MKFDKLFFGLMAIITIFGAYGFITMNSAEGLGNLPIFWAVAIGTLGMLVSAYEYYWMRKNSAKEKSTLLRLFKTAVYLPLGLASGALVLIYSGISASIMVGFYVTLLAVTIWGMIRTWRTSE